MTLPKAYGLRPVGSNGKMCLFNNLSVNSRGPSSPEIEGITPFA